ncbi:MULTISPECIES: cyclodeaminase/cyclohydrolase family protein [Actinomycetospora]|uniref:cyclodeaminase/cyclohydrolase family protein n=1 Tax=Actinomycetospora TaxID=402649 RepID=UPI001E2FEA20|nr:cyclodeaminase/cyclohydrolase family protein [Actinomycetospora soli]MCD2188161.1 cyclodeaminase/cyclohydrolase family protein [Actinomycetospora soli]
MRNRTVEGFLEDLATRAPAAGGGAAAALHAAHGAALVALAARLGAGEGPDEVAATVRRRADELRGSALELVDAADPVRVVTLVGQVLALAETLRPVARRAVLGDVAAAAEVLRAAAGTARVRIEAALPGVTDAAERADLLEVADHVDDLVLRAAKVTAAVREQLVR